MLIDVAFGQSFLAIFSTIPLKPLCLHAATTQSSFGFITLDLITGFDSLGVNVTGFPLQRSRMSELVNNSSSDFATFIFLFLRTVMH